MNTKVTIAGVELKNPVMTASGTFGSGAEFSEFYDLGALGAVVTKGVANVPWPGNPTPRIAETRSGMLNAIGLQNPGIDVFVKRDIPFLKNMIQRSLSMCVARVKRITARLWSVWQMSRWICWRSMYPALTSKKAVSHLARILKHCSILQSR